MLIKRDRMSKITQLNAKYKRELTFWAQVPAFPYAIAIFGAGNWVSPDTAGSDKGHFCNPGYAIAAGTILTVVPVLPALTILAIGIAILGILYNSLCALVEYSAAGISKCTS